MVSLEFGSQTVLIRDPLLGDSRILSLGTKIKVARNGQKWGYAKPLQQETLNLNWQYLDRSKAVELMAFLDSAMGQIVTLKMDQDNSVWVGKLIKEPQTEHQSRADSTIQLTFVGTKNL